MRLFHISDVLSVTTGRLVGSRHIAGVYEILNFLTGDELFTHQLPRAMNECTPWLRTQFPNLFPEGEEMKGLIEGLDVSLSSLKKANDSARGAAITAWVENVRVHFALPVQVPVYEMDAEMHTHIDPMEEARAMVGDDKVIGIEL